MKNLTATEKRFLQFMNAQYLSERIPVDFKILGLDLAKYKTGYTLLKVETRNQKLSVDHLKTDLIYCSTSLTVQKSVSEFYEKIYQILDKERPEVISYEYIAVATELTGFKALAKVEAALQIAINQIYPKDELPLLLPISVKTAKKIALQRDVPDMEAAKLLAAELEINKSLDKRTLDKLSIMVATERNFGMKFRDDNECDSFLVANCALAICSFLNDTVMAGLTHEFVDKEFMRFMKDSLKCTNKLKVIQNEIAVSYLASAFSIKENDIAQYSKTVKEIKRRFYNIIEESDIDISELDTDSDD